MCHYRWVQIEEVWPGQVATSFCIFFRFPPKETDSLLSLRSDVNFSDKFDAIMKSYLSRWVQMYVFWDDNMMSLDKKSTHCLSHSSYVFSFCVSDWRRPTRDIQNWLKTTSTWSQPFVTSRSWHSSHLNAFMKGCLIWMTNSRWTILNRGRPWHCWANSIAFHRLTGLDVKIVWAVTFIEINPVSRSNGNKLYAIL